VSQYCQTSSIYFSFFLTNGMCCFWDIPNSYKKWGTYSFFYGFHLYVCIWSQTYDGDLHYSSWHHDSIVTWLFDPQHYLSMLSMSFPSSYANCNHVLAPLPPPLGLLLYVRPMLIGLRYIFKLTTHTHHQLDHFHSLATSCVKFLPMNIGLLCSSPIDIMLGVINGFYSCSLSILLTTDCPQEIVASCSQNMG
jgi:hypothetical protein